jgi:hypothetical protein
MENDTNKPQSLVPVDRLIFVYKANGGALNAVIDSAKKLLSADGCALCDITHGFLGEKSGWKECRAELGIPVEYLHLDEIDSELADFLGDNLPAVVAHAGTQRILLLGPDVLERCRGKMDDFRERLKYHAALNSLLLNLP